MDIQQELFNDYNFLQKTFFGRVRIVQTVYGMLKGYGLVVFIIFL